MSVLLALLLGCGSPEECTEHTRWLDADGDGWGDPFSPITSCEGGDAAITWSDEWGRDCDDSRASVHPLADEVCNGLDDDCDGEIDERATDATTWYGDGDGDGYGDEDERQVACQQPAGFVAVAGDCDDSCPACWEGAEEICGDGVDNDCDGTAPTCGWGAEVRLDTAAARLVGSEPHDELGWTLGGPGDLDHDGQSDLVIGSWRLGEGDSGGGRVHIVHGSVRGGHHVDEVAYATIEDTTAGSSLGLCAVRVGDLAGAGSDLLAVCDGAWGEAGRGVVHLFSTDLAGTVGPDHAVAHVLAEGEGDWLGWSSAAVDPEGLNPGLVLGAPSAEGGGAAWLLRGPLSGSVEIAAVGWRLGAEASGDDAGTAVTSLRDTDGDGIDDLAIGAPGAGSGRVYVVLGDLGGDLALSDADGILHADHRSSLGQAVVGGDVDGDGHGDLWAGAPGSQYDDSRGAGGVYLHLGPVTGSRLALGDADGHIGGSSYDFVGWGLAGLRDADGDTLPDLALYTGGRTAVLLGLVRGSIHVDEADHQLIPETGSDTAWPATGAGDVDGDGLSDLLVADREWGTLEHGAAWLVLAVDW